ncbi:isoflavone reductase family protein [Paecilomyces variotii No. 5]|uniref:Isoflavone reductase family protein n=1 Tax=Byssochlamys spectabilis (strain No. 5 / NBRC 109023) TaxID=1356009 RepID=V5G179_BYSSN|nr:isoflavone reductase family protein [Paecilomyces variotii No. 5]
MIKIAIAGTSGLAQYMGHYLDTQTSHQFIFLSRNPNPGLSAKGWQVIQVNYTDVKDLHYKLTGIDIVISTIQGQAQLALIDAAAHMHVRRFIPAEFEGLPALRPQSDILDRGKTAALNRLAHYRTNNGMESAVFACGVFYERFAPGGMASLQLGQSIYANNEGDYLMDIRRMAAQIPYLDPAGNEVRICLTSAQDVVRFVVEALELPEWPTEFTMCGDRMTLNDVVGVAENMMGIHQFHRVGHSVESLQHSLEYATSIGNMPEQWRLYQLLATAAGRYDFEEANLNAMVDVQPLTGLGVILGSWVVML